MSSDDLNECAALVERGDPDRFRAVMAAPVAARGPLFALYAFNVEVSRAPWVTQEAMIAEMRLQWWRDALDEIASGGAVRRHAVVTPLAGLLSDADCAVLDDLILARRWDIYRDPFEDTAAFETFLDQTAGGLLWVAARLLGAPDTAEAALRDIGYAQGLANWLRAIRALEAAGRVPLVDGRPEAVAALAAQGAARLARGRQALRLPKAARPAVLAAWQAGPILRQAAQTPARVAQGALGLSGAGSQLRLIIASVLGR